MKQKSRYADSRTSSNGRVAPRIPQKFSKKFLEKMDGRYILVRELRAAYDEITADQGGAEHLSHVKRSLCEKFVWLEAILRGIERQIAESGTDGDSAELLSRWIQGLNSLTGLARTLGLERRARKLDLKDYVEGKRA